MGVSGSGKSTLATALAQRLGLRMVDGDDLHLPESVAKMRAGIALEDEDRWPWLDRVGQQLAGSPSPGIVLACSALRQVYRERIRQNAASVQFVFLDGSFELIAQRLSQRVGHYMQAGLLESQFRTLERPASEENDVVVLDIQPDVATLTELALNALGLSQAIAGCAPFALPGQAR
jgi:gluconokinase